MKNSYKLAGFGFTLAEVLITLGIIGIVAALTLPSLLSNFRDKVMVSQAKKSYSNFQNVLNKMMADEGYTDYAGIFNTDETQLQKVQKFARYYNSAKVCSSVNQGCGKVYPVKLATPTNNGSGGLSKEYFDFPRIVTTDGSAIYFRNIRQNCEPFTYQADIKDSNGFSTGEKQTITDTRCTTVIFDVNGENKGPNQYGADIHQVLILPKKLSVIEGAQGALNSILLQDKLKYQKYPDDMRFDK